MILFCGLSLRAVRKVSFLAGQARDSCAEIGFKNHVNYNDLLITSVSTSLDAVPNFLFTASDRVRLPELRQVTPARHHGRN